MNEYTFTVKDQEFNLIIQSLAELPAKISMNLIVKLQYQANEKKDKENATVKAIEKKG